MSEVAFDKNDDLIIISFSKNSKYLIGNCYIISLLNLDQLLFFVELDEFT